MDKQDFTLLLAAALRAVSKAAPVILEVYQHDFKVAGKADQSPITEADRRSHQIITRELSLLKWKKSIPILSEEGLKFPFEERRRWDFFWLVDPLDGTKEFVKRNGEFTINIALIEIDKPVLGVVYAPVLDLLYFGLEGDGSFKLESLLSLHGACLKEEEAAAEVYGYIIKQAQRLKRINGRREMSKDKSKITVARSRSHRSREFDRFIRKLKATYKEVELLAMGSALKICLVAEGRADIYPRFGPTMEWDTAAAHIIANEAGRKLCSIDSGAELSYNKEDLHNSAFIAR